jgi:CIC family chloride channel protein
VLRFGVAGKTLAYGVVVGLVSGLGAILFFLGLEWFSHTTMVEWAGVHPLVPAGERIFSGPGAFEGEVEALLRSAPTRYARAELRAIGADADRILSAFLAGLGPSRPWLFFLLPALGGLVAGLIVYTWAPEAEGHGTDAMIDAFHRKRGIIRGRVPFLKGLATIATLGTGGSAGREGPIAQIGAGFGSWLAQRLRLTARQRRILLLSGTAGGLGAIFRAPLGGALTAVEVLYREDFEAEALLPSIVSSVTAYAVFSAVFGYDRIFALPETLVFRDPVELAFYAVLGLVCVPVGILYIRVFYGTRDRIFRPLRIPRHVKPMLGGLGVGLLGLVLPGVYGAGWGSIQLALFGQLSLGLMLALAAGKILATSLTIGSGGSGGVFGPTLFIGGMLGGAVGLAANALFPEIVTQPGAYVLVGMAAFFAGVASAPLGVLLMTCEMTGGYDLIAPLLLVSAIALVFTRKWSIYEKQVKDKFHSEAHLGERAMNLLESVPLRRILPSAASPIVLRDDMNLAHLRQMLAETDQNDFPVRNRSGELCGLLQLSVARPVLLEEGLDGVLIVADLVSPLVALRPDDSLYDALRLFNETGYTELPVVDPDDPNVLLGLVRHDMLTAAYQERLAAVRAQIADEDGAAAGVVPAAPVGYARPAAARAATGKGSDDAPVEPPHTSSPR